MIFTKSLYFLIIWNSIIYGDIFDIKYEFNKSVYNNGDLLRIKAILKNTEAKAISFMPPFSENSLEVDIRKFDHLEGHDYESHSSVKIVTFKKPELQNITLNPKEEKAYYFTQILNIKHKASPFEYLKVLIRPKNGFSGSVKFIRINQTNSYNFYNKKLIEKKEHGNHLYELFSYLHFLDIPSDDLRTKYKGKRNKYLEHRLVLREFPNSKAVLIKEVENLFLMDQYLLKTIDGFKTLNYKDLIFKEKHFGKISEDSKVSLNLINGKPIVDIKPK